MSWKERYQIADLPAHTKLEVTCKSCGKFRYITIGHIQRLHPVRTQYIDEFEAYRICHVWGCGGECRVAIPADSETEGFQGGLA